VLSGEATNTNFKIFGLTRPGLEPTIYRTRDEHTNYNATGAAVLNTCIKPKILKLVFVASPLSTQHLEERLVGSESE
jgi:hypothetical protein